MPRGRGQHPLLTISDVENLKGKGMNQTQIAEKYGVTRQYISWILSQHGKQDPRREALREYWPWDVAVEHRTAQASYALREHVAYTLLGPDHLTKEGPRLLNWLYGELALGRVVEYDPTIPRRGREPAGWIFRDRQVTDGDLIIRVNKYTDLTEDMEKAWHMPQPIPKFSSTTS